MEIKDTQTNSQAKILDLDMYRLKMKLRDSGVECLEDSKGQFKIWLRLAPLTTGAHS